MSERGKRNPGGQCYALRPVLQAYQAAARENRTLSIRQAMEWMATTLNTWPSIETVQYACKELCRRGELEQTPSRLYRLANSGPEARIARLTDLLRECRQQLPAGSLCDRIDAELASYCTKD